MMYEILPETKDAFVALRLTGKLDEKDYEALLPMLKELIARHGKISLYWEMREFEGWTMDGLLSDAAFDAEHTDDFVRIAMVGEKKWHDWMTKLMKPFTSAEVRYFELDQAGTALSWAKA